ncbi:MAG: tetratricopeptide repeat protein, partial [Calditrichia bacterium]
MSSDKSAAFAAFFMFFLLIVMNAHAVNPDEEPVKSLIEQGIELTITNNFEGAAQLYQQLIDQYPKSPMGYFYKGATLQARMLDREDYSRQDEFFGLMDKTIDLAVKQQESGAENAWNYFYEGSAYLYRSFMKSKLGKWFPAYRDAVRGVDRLEAAIKMDSLLYDAYMGVGSFKYWKSARASFLSWLPFISDEREEGIRMIRQAIEKGDFVYWVGRDQLCWILLNEGREEEAFVAAQENLTAYPQSRFFKWTLVSAALHSHRLDLSRELYKELLDDIRSLPENNHYNELDCLVSLAEIERDSENWSDAFRYADEALRLQIDSTIRKRSRDRLEKALKIRNMA